MRQKKSIQVCNYIKDWVIVTAFIMPNIYLAALLLSDDNSELFRLDLFLSKLGIVTIFYIEYCIISRIRIPYRMMRTMVRLLQKIEMED